MNEFTQRQQIGVEAPDSGAAARQGPRLPLRALLKIPRRVVAVVAAVLLALIACIDIVTPENFSFAVWYMVPVVLVTWVVGRRPGYIMAVVCVAAWFGADMLGASPSFPKIFAYLNAASRLLFFLPAVAILAAFRDLRTRLETRVEERTEALRRLASQLSAAEDSERRRLASDIHDGFGQILTLLKLNLAAAVSDTAEGSPDRQRISDSIAMVNDLIERSRTLTFDLHPAMLDHLGLAPTLGRYAEQFARRTKIEVTVSEDGTRRPLPETVANYLFRSTKELLNNAAKHGDSKQIVIAVHWAAQLIRVVVDDDGRGFNVDQVLAAGFHEGLGLASIRERIRSLGGVLRLESSSGLGTRVVMELPVTGQETSV